jgi:hypothetical protein
MSVIVRCENNLFEQQWVIVTTGVYYLTKTFKELRSNTSKLLQEKRVW